MNRTARKLIPAVAVVAVLGTGLASAATSGGTKHTSRTAASGAQVHEESKPVSPPAATPAATPAVEPAAVPAPAPATATAAAARPVQASETKAAPPPVATPAPKSENGWRANCDRGEGTYRPATEAEFRTVMTGVWLVCESPSLFGTGEAGMEISADGRWSKLERTPGGGLARSAGWENEGTWTTNDTSAMNGRPTYQINFYVAGGGGHFSSPDFGEGSTSAAVTKVHFDNVPGFDGDYVPAAPDTKILPVPFPPAPGQGCEAREEPYSPTTEAEFRSAMVGSWLVCSKPTFFGSDEDGLEIRADGRWSKLYRTSNNAVVRATGPENEGTWDVVDTSAMNGRPLYQINFKKDGSDGWRGTHPHLAGDTSEVTKIRLTSDYGIYVADYIPAPARTGVTGP